MHSLQRYKAAFEEYFGVSIVDVWITDIVDKMINLHFLTTNSIATHIRYIRFYKVIVNHNGVHSPLVRLNKEVPVEKKLYVLRTPMAQLFIFLQKKENPSHYFGH